MVEFGLIVIYGCIFIHLRRLRAQVAHFTDNGSMRNAAISPKKITRLAAFMLMYPTAFVVGTLPLAAGRMVTFTHPSFLPQEYWIVAAVCICSCGLIDSILYAVTRRTAFQNKDNDCEPENASVTTSAYRHGSVSSNYISEGNNTGSLRSHTTNEPDSPYSLSNDTMGSLNTNTPLTRPANFSSPSPSIYSNNRQQYSDSAYLSPTTQARPTLSLVTDLDAGCPGYGYPSASPGQNSCIHLDELSHDNKEIG
jgi:hypothetical protein